MLPSIIRALLLSTILTGYLIASDGEDGTSSAPVEQNLSALIELGIATNPGLKAARARWMAAIQYAESRGVLNDPTLSIAYYAQSVETRVGPQKAAIMVGQSFPWFGKLKTERKIANMQAEVAYHRYAEKAQLTGLEIEHTFWEYQYTLHSIEITDRNVELLKSIEGVIFTKYATSQAGHPDIITAQTDRLQLEDRLRSLNAMLASRHRNLVNALGFTPEDDDLNRWFENHPPNPPRIFPEDAAEIALHNHGYQSALVNMSVAAQSVRLANYASKPNFTIGGNLIITDLNPAMADDAPGNGKDPLVISVGLSLPIHFRRNRAKIATAIAKKQSADYSAGDMAGDIETAATLAQYGLSDAADRITLLEEALIPLAREGLGATERAYIGDRVNYNTLINAQRTILNYELQLHRAIADAAMANARLKALSGNYTVIEDNPKE